MQIALTINDRKVAADVEPRLLLVQLLRERLGLTGVHVGCETSLCGACTVLIDGLAVKSCTRLAVQCDGQAITTIEGLAEGETLHPMQAAFQEKHGLQCGFCTPGMILTAVELVATGQADDDLAIRHGLAGNLCRCTGYQKIVEAVCCGAGREVHTAGPAGLHTGAHS